MRLDDPVDRLRGIGPKLRQGLEEAGVVRVQDLLFHLPGRYQDRSRTVAIGELREPGATVLVRARAERVVVHRARRGMAVVRALLSDPSGSLEAVWFNQRWLAPTLRRSGELYCYGRLHLSPQGRLELVNPEVEAAVGETAPGIVPSYSPLGPLAGRRLERAIAQAVTLAPEIEDPLPMRIRGELSLPPLASALATLHSPATPETGEAVDRLLEELNHARSPAHRRLAFDELLAFSCGVAAARRARRALRAPALTSPLRPDALAREMLRFPLTGAQRRVVREILADMARPHPMARLLQGDVGSGKTAVAALALRATLESGHQAALMAPTELLAEQHARTLGELFAGSGHEVALLTSSLPSGRRRQVTSGLADGRIGAVVGTHALIARSLGFRRLGLAVVDEQHRFGTAQRQALQAKGETPHLLVMTATPIPRSLALTLYGDLDLSIIDELPPGRRPVTTAIRPESAKKRLYAFLRRELGAGGRAFFVYPAIDAGALDLRALTSGVAEVRAELPQARVGVLHGRMQRDQREEVEEAFRRGELELLLATTVVEVGIDVPEASVMVVFSPERYGLSQLHQLRGRVGRGGQRSWCVLLVGDEIGERARARLEILCRTSDGFEIAEADLRLRGPGELTGLRQWGPFELRFADLWHHHDLLEQARATAARLEREGRLVDVVGHLGRLFPVPTELPAG